MSHERQQGPRLSSPRRPGGDGAPSAHTERRRMQRQVPFSEGGQIDDGHEEGDLRRRAVAGDLARPTDVREGDPRQGGHAIHEPDHDVGRSPQRAVRDADLQRDRLGLCGCGIDEADAHDTVQVVITLRHRPVRCARSHEQPATPRSSASRSTKLATSSYTSSIGRLASTRR